MAFPGDSETELLLSLQKAVVEESGWSGFLARLADMTGASFAAMIIAERGSGDTVRLMSATSRGRSAEVSASALAIILSVRLRPERIYSEIELSDLEDSIEAGAALGDLEVSAWRAMRVNISDTLSITVGIFGAIEFSAADGAILRRLVPYLQSSTHAAAIIWRERMRASTTADLARKTNFGWFLLDRAGLIVDMSFNQLEETRGIRVITGAMGDRLAFADQRAESTLADILDQCVAQTAARSWAIRLSHDPTSHLRISLFSISEYIGSGKPVAIATMYGEAEISADGAYLLVDLFGLLPSEAKLAAALARGQSLAEAANQLGLTVETARNYSKKIFAKTGTRGQADLVRLILVNGFAELQ